MTEREDSYISGTLAGGKAAALTNLSNDPDFYRKIGALGGAAPTAKKKGFACDNRTFLQKLMKKPKRATLAGRKGGHISTRKLKEIT